MTYTRYENTCGIREQTTQYTQRRALPAYVDRAPSAGPPSKHGASGQLFHVLHFLKLTIKTISNKYNITSALTTT